MNQTAISIDGLREAIERLPKDALTAMREAALANIDEHGLPSTRDEDWKYTDLGDAIDISNRWLKSNSSVSTTDAIGKSIKSITSSIEANWLVIANGVIDSSQFGESADVEIERFSDSAAPFVMDRPLADLNAALLHDGLRVRLNAATEKPIGLLIIDEAATDAVVSQASVEIEVSSGCDVEIIEYHTSIGEGDHYQNSVVALKVNEAATANYVRIQDRRIGHIQTGRLSIAMGKDSRLNMASFDLGGSMVRNDVDIDLSESGADVVFNGLYLAGDHCRCVWNGKAIVHEGADGTDANQANHNLLLSDHAEIDAKPELEIYADDVKCSHGTTVGQLDEASLFYLRSRGLDKRKATQILVHAFAVDLIGRTPVSAVSGTITDLVEARLAELIQDDVS
jgi:Fe-S cluster assembly protein SufD